MAATNPVLLGSFYISIISKSVKIDEEKLKESAKQWAGEKLTIPDWKAPVLPDNADDATVDFLGLGCAIDFAFTDFKTGKKYEAAYNGVKYTGSYGMWAALKRGVEEGERLLDGSYLASMSKDDSGRLLERDGPIPLFEERHKIFREIGKVLEKKYDSHFHNLLRKSENRIFNGGGGVVERLVSEFPSFRDTWSYNGSQVQFNKRAQLFPGLLQGKFLGCGVTLFPEQDVRELTVFPDYQLPRALAALGILKYSPALKEKIDNGKLIEKGSKEEIEIRANTVVAAKKIEDEIIKAKPESGVNALHIDYKLWSEGRKIKEGRHHLTKTTAY